MPQLTGGTWREDDEEEEESESRDAVDGDEDGEEGRERERERGRSKQASKCLASPCPTLPYHSSSPKSHTSSCRLLRILVCGGSGLKSRSVLYYDAAVRLIVYSTLQEPEPEMPADLVRRKEKGGPGRTRSLSIVVFRRRADIAWTAYTEPLTTHTVQYSTVLHTI